MLCLTLLGVQFRNKIVLKDFTSIQPLEACSLQNSWYGCEEPVFLHCHHWRYNLSHHQILQQKCWTFWEGNYVYRFFILQLALLSKFDWWVPQNSLVDNMHSWLKTPVKIVQLKIKIKFNKIVISLTTNACHMYKMHTCSDFLWNLLHGKLLVCHALTIEFNA